MGGLCNTAPSYGGGDFSGGAGAIDYGAGSTAYAPPGISAAAPGVSPAPPPLLGAPVSSIAAGGGAGGSPSFLTSDPATAAIMGGQGIDTASAIAMGGLPSTDPSTNAIMTGYGIDTARALDTGARPAAAGPAPVAVTAPAAAPGSLSSVISDPSAGNIGDFALKHLGTIAGAGILGYEAMNRPKIPAGAKPEAVTGALTGQAQELGAQGAAMTAPLTTGQLPAGAQSAVDQAVKSAQATIRSRFASEGLSGSPMEAEALAQAEMQGPQIGFQIAQQMAQTGISELGLSANIYNGILQNVLQQDQHLQDALTQFAAAAAGGGATTLKLSA